MRKAIHSDENQDFSRLSKIYKLENKIIALSKANTTLVIVEKKIFVMYIKNKGLGKFIFYFILIICSALEIQVFFININIIILVTYMPFADLFGVFK